MRDDALHNEPPPGENKKKTPRRSIRKTGDTKSSTPRNAKQTPDVQVTVSSRIRLARNLRGIPFPGQATPASLMAVAKQVRETLQILPRMENGHSYPMNSTNEVQKLYLFEKHLISRDLMDRATATAWVSPDEQISVMINEEDHLRIQGIRPGMSLKDIWQDVDALDDAMEEKLAYSFSPSLGYLTSCPSNVGTGMRASVLLHVSALVLLNEMLPIVNGLNKIGLTVRGLWGEGTEAVGHMFQISNQVTLGMPEARIIADLEQIVLEIVEHEKNARIRLMEAPKKELFVRDHVGRAMGILTHATLLSTREALDLLAGLRLGVDLGIVQGVKRETIDRLMICIQPGHLQYVVRRDLKPQDRDAMRAKVVRDALSRA